jgi:hypothetical protein
LRAARQPPGSTAFPSQKPIASRRAQGDTRHDRSDEVALAVGLGWNSPYGDIKISSCNFDGPPIIVVKLKEQILEIEGHWHAGRAK